MRGSRSRVLSISLATGARSEVFPRFPERFRARRPQAARLRGPSRRGFAGSTAFRLQWTSDQACGAENSSERRFSSRSTWIAQNLKRFLRCFRLPAGFIADGFRRFSGSNGLRIRRPGLKRCQKGAVPSSWSPFRSSFLARVGRSLDFSRFFGPRSPVTPEDSGVFRLKRAPDQASRAENGSEWSRSGFPEPIPIESPRQKGPELGFL